MLSIIFFFKVVVLKCRSGCLDLYETFFLGSIHPNFTFKHYLFFKNPTLTNLTRPTIAVSHAAPLTSIKKWLTLMSDQTNNLFISTASLRLVDYVGY